MTLINDFIQANIQNREELRKKVDHMLNNGAALSAPGGYPHYGYTLMNTTIARYKPWDVYSEPNRSVLSDQAVYNVMQMNRLAVDGIGYELGVYDGGISKMLMESGRKMVCFDTFKGIQGSGDHDHLEDGEYAVFNPEEVIKYLDGAEIVMGDVLETLLDRLELVAFVHLDMDVFIPTAFALRHIWPRLVEGGIIMCDDYGVWCTQGVKQAVDEFIDTEPDVRTIYFPTGQMAIIKP